MKIVIATPLYPPDIADPAPYVKELAKRLVGGASVTVVTYGALPEQIEGVTIRAIPKRSPAWVRVPRFALTLARAAWSADLIYVQTGLSAELPAALVVALSRTKVLLRIDSSDGEKKTDSKLFAGTVRRFLIWRAKAAVKNDDALVRPEIMPLEPRPDAALAAYESAWAKHVTAIFTV